MTDGPQHYGSFGLRRLDGEPWRSEPSEPGGHDYWVRGNETTEDGMVLVMIDLLDVVAAFLDEPTAQPGKTEIVRWGYQPGDSGAVIVWYPVDDVLVRLRNTATFAATLLGKMQERT